MGHEVLGRDGAGLGGLDGKALRGGSDLAVGRRKLNREGPAQAGHDAHGHRALAGRVGAGHARRGVHRGLRANDAHHGARLDGARGRAGDRLATGGVCYNVGREELRGVAHGAKLKQVARAHRGAQAHRDLGAGKAAHAGAAAVGTAAALDGILKHARTQDLAHDLAAVVGPLVAHHLVARGAHEIGVGEVAVKGALKAAVDVGLLGLVHLAPGDLRVDGLAIRAHDLVDVVGRLHATLDLERAHPRGDHLVHLVHQAVILGAKRARAAHAAARLGKARRGDIGDVLHDALLVIDLVGQAAGLGAHAAVGRAPARHRAEHAHARVAEAQGAVAKALQLNAGAGDLLDLGQGKLARQGHAVGAAVAAPQDAALVVDVGLGRDVCLYLGPSAADFLEKAPVLDDEGVGAQKPGLADQGQDARNLLGGHHDVDRHVDAHAGQVGLLAGIGKGLGREVGGATTGVEVVAKAAVDGVGARGKGGGKRLWAAGRRQKLDDVLVSQGFPLKAVFATFKRYRERCGPRTSRCPRREEHTSSGARGV